MDEARRIPRLWLALILAPLALALLGAFALARESRALLAPLLGPWAGVPLGHGECTMGAMLPAVSCTAVALGLAALASLAIARGPNLRPLRGSLALLWSWSWSALALLSVLNTRS